MAQFKQVTIVGLGLIGGSLGMAIRRRRLARRVVGLSRTMATVRAAKRRGAIDAGTTDANTAVQDADLVIIATPVGRIVPQARRLARLMRPGAMLMDVGSTKKEIVSALDHGLPRDIAFVGAHPLAGSEQQGIGAACAHLFDHSTCVLTQTRNTDRRALGRAQAFWNRLAQRVLVLSPDEHDRCLAAVSHLPHLLAFCLIEATDRRALAMAPRSFLDVTRVANSDPDLWDDIFMSNRRALAQALRRLEDRCHRIQSLLRDGKSVSVKRVLRRAQVRRRSLRDG